MATLSSRLCHKVINFVILNTFFRVHYLDMVNLSEFTIFWGLKMIKLTIEMRLFWESEPPYASKKNLTKPRQNQNS